MMPDDSIDERQWREAVASLELPMSQARGLPNEVYTSEAFAKLESERLFGRGWTAVASASDLPQPGDMLPFQIGGRPFVLVRNRAREVRGFHNVCSHRGLQLVDKPCHGRAVIRCPYHSWAYDLDGALRATPDLGGPREPRVEGMEPARLGLRPVAIHCWHDIVYADVSGQAPPFEEFARPLMVRFAAYDLSVLKRAARIDWEIEANWKLVLENFVESYHLSFIHPQVDEYSRAEDHYDIIDGPVCGSGNLTAITAEAAAGPLPKFPKLPPDLTRAGQFVALFPNTLIFLMPDSMLVILVEPLSATRVREQLLFYFIGEGASDPTFEDIRRRQIEAWRHLNSQDTPMVERLQIGRRSSAFAGGVFSPYWDKPTVHVQKLIAKAMKGSLHG
jgi:choline monooxygenase